jgi:hypothetical protein
MARRGAPLALALVLAAITAPAGAQESRQVLPAGEATYHRGLGLVLSQTYPRETHHVVLTGGEETSRAYLRFELPEQEDDVVLGSVTLTVPLAPDAGTTAPETAQVDICPVPGGLEDGAAEAPEAVCDGAPRARFEAEPRPTLIADVTRLVRNDRIDLALVPTAGGGDWHVAFDSRAREGGSPALVTLSFEEVPTPSAPTDLDVPSPAVEAPAAPSIGGGTISIPDLSPPPAAAGQSIAQEAGASDASSRRATPAAALGDAGFQYPIVFALPLVLLVAIGVAGHGLTRPVVLPEEQA